ncbi:MAG TPA: VanZ family protein [Terracidiphilus sp.]|nr:VanZ family protein [Terracidiphilus sp.]
MSSSGRGVKFWISAWLPVALGIVVIAFESTVWFGADHTSSPLRWLYQAIFGPVTDAQWLEIHHFIRKCGHFVFYGLLGLAWLRAWWLTLALRSLAFWRCALLALAGTALVASCDEWHQTFLPNRTGTPWDVLLDCCGATVMILLIYAFARAFRTERLRRA